MPDLKKDMNLSTVLALVTLAMALGTGWSSLQSAVTGVEAKVADHDRRLLEVEGKNEASRADTMRVLQDIAEIKTDLRYLRQAMEQGGGKR
jgi:hypothetical protein